MSDVWQKLRPFTQARIGLRRSGHATSTIELLKFQRAHAEARDAVWAPWRVHQLADTLQALGEETEILTAMARDRAEFLKRPDLGRRLRSPLKSRAREISFIVSDGLSAKAIDRHFPAFWEIFAPRLSAAGFEKSPLVLVPFGRVAVADEIGEAQNAKLAVIFIGERPGLSSTDSLGIYLTYEPRVGKNDAQRNCLSNVRPPEGMSYDLAADKLIYFIRESLRLKLSGVELKEQDHSLINATPNPSALTSSVVSPRTKDDS